MCDEADDKRELKTLEAAMASLRPNTGRLDDQWCDMLGDRIANASAGVEQQIDEPSITTPTHIPTWVGRFLPAGILSHQVSLLIVFVATLVAWYFSSIDYPRVDQGKLTATATGETYEVNPTVVARVTGAVDCQWAEGVESPSYLGNLIIGQWLRLDAGLLEITYHSGAKIVLQGPTVYEVCADGGYLESGELVGTSGDAPINNLLSPKNGKKHRVVGPAEVQAAPVKFLLRAPVVDVFDLGTEFGVKVDSKTRTTQVHVFEGFAALCSPIAVAQRASVVLRAREAMQFSPTEDGQECISQKIAIAPGDFACRIPKLEHPTKDSDPGIDAAPKR